MSTYGESFDDPRDERDGHYQHVAEFKNETKRQSETFRAEIADLKLKRQNLRMSAATTAGVIGLRYLAETNSYVRLVGAMDEEIVLPEVVSRPEPLAPQAIEQSKEESKPVIGEFKPAGARWLQYGDIALWLFAISVGYFIGLGLITIAGMNWKAEPFLHILALLVGFSVVAALKLMVSQAWRLVGRAQALGARYGWRIAVAMFVTLSGIALDAHLGASALRKYMEERAFDSSSVPGYWQLLLLALAVTSPLLLASAFFAYEKADREPSREEREQGRHEREAERRESVKRERIARQDAERQRHRVAMQDKIEGELSDQRDLAQRKYDERKKLDDERAEDWADLKNNAEYKCLQGLIGQIGVLTIEIAERERELTNYKISRGYEKSAEFPNGRPSAPQQADVEKVGEGSEDEGKPYAS